MFQQLPPYFREEERIPRDVPRFQLTGLPLCLRCLDLSCPLFSLHALASFPFPFLSPFPLLARRSGIDSPVYFVNVNSLLVSTSGDQIDPTFFLHFSDISIDSRISVRRCCLFPLATYRTLRVSWLLRSAWIDQPWQVR